MSYLKDQDATVTFANFHTFTTFLAGMLYMLIGRISASNAFSHIIMVQDGTTDFFEDAVR